MTTSVNLNLPNLQTVTLTTSDLDRSIGFYRDLLGFRVIGQLSLANGITTTLLDIGNGHVLNLNTVVGTAKPCAWDADDLQTGLRHVAFKVRDVDGLYAKLSAANVEFTLTPLDATGDVRIAFFKDPDGALLEIVAKELNYHVDGPSYGQFPPLKPQGDELLFDHVAVTVSDLDKALTFYCARFGFPVIGQLYFHDERDFVITYLRAGDAVLELFSYSASNLPTPDTSDPAVVGIKHASFKINDVETLVRNLKAAGVPILAEDSSTHTALVEGPDRLIWELIG